MRVITGTARGRKLKTPDGYDVTRPTSDKVKEALFSIIQFELENANVLDLFAGSGQLGIEALSRGAKSATFIDNDKGSIEVVKDNLKTTNLFTKAVVLCADGVSYIKSSKVKFDIIFIDPPYNKGIIDEVLPYAAGCCNDNAIIICETESREELPETAGNFVKFREYKHSKTKLTTYRKG